MCSRNLWYDTRNMIFGVELCQFTCGAWDKGRLNFGLKMKTATFGTRVKMCSDIECLSIETGKNPKFLCYSKWLVAFGMWIGCVLEDPHLGPICSGIIAFLVTVVLNLGKRRNTGVGKLSRDILDSHGV